MDQNLQFQLQYLFIKYKEGIKRSKNEISRLVPKIKPPEQANLDSELKKFSMVAGDDSYFEPPLPEIIAHFNKLRRSNMNQLKLVKFLRLDRCGK